MRSDRLIQACTREKFCDTHFSAATVVKRPNIIEISISFIIRETFATKKDASAHHREIRNKKKETKKRNRKSQNGREWLMSAHITSRLKFIRFVFARACQHALRRRSALADTGCKNMISMYTQWPIVMSPRESARRFRISAPSLLKRGQTLTMIV